jgi:hypothetical protein
MREWQNITVEVIEVDQTIATSDIMSMKGCNDLDLDLVKSMCFFSSKDMSPEADVTIILGRRFTIDSNAHPKMLLLCFSSSTMQLRGGINCKGALPHPLSDVWPTRLRGSKTRWWKT